MNDTQIEVIEFDAATAGFDDLLQIAELVIATWPLAGASAESSARAARASQDTLTPGDRLQYVIRDAGKIVAHSACFPRRISIAGEFVTILALASVCTDKNYRGRGLGSAVVKACFARVDRGGFPWCLYQTAQHNRHFYESLNAAVVHNRFVNSLADDPNANPWWDDTPMAYPANKPFPSGVVDLLGPGY